MKFTSVAEWDSNGEPAPGGRPGDAVVLVDRDNLVIYASPALERLLERPVRSGMTKDDLLALVYPGDASRAKAAWRSLIAHPGQGGRFQVRGSHADGSAVPLELHVEDLRSVPGVEALVLRPTVHAPTESGGRATSMTPRRFVELLGGSPAPAALIAPTGALAAVNAAFAILLGYDEAELRRRHLLALVHPDDAAIADAMRMVLLDGALDSMTGAVRLLRSDGMVVDLRSSASRLADAGGATQWLLLFVEDISHRGGAHADLAGREARFRVAFDDGPTAAALLSTGGTILRANHAMARLTGRSESALVGTSLAEMVDPDDVAVVVGRIEDLAGGAAPTAALEVRAPLVDGRPGHVQLGLAVAAPPGGRPAFLVANLTDLTERIAIEAELAHQAFHDPLTGLSNRNLLIDRLTHALARRDHGDVAVLFLDLNHFKTVNDTFGHEAGDRLLVAMANRIRQVLRPSDTIARFGGDEFVVLCEALSGSAAAVEIADRVIEAVEIPYRIGDAEVVLSASIGIALASRSGTDPETMLRDADSAMYHAKAQGKAHLLDPAITTSSTSTKAGGAAPLPHLHQNELRAALANDEIEVVFQPQVAFPEGVLTGFEALARWNHPVHGPLPAATFLPLALSSGLIGAIGEHVITETCRQAAAWRDRLPQSRGLVVAFNLSGAELGRPDLLHMIDAILESTGAEPATLCAEISERNLLLLSGAGRETLARLRAFGMRVSVEDTGPAFATLALGSPLPIDEVKIDHLQLRKTCDEDQARETIAALVAAARVLDLRTVAEGIETEDQARQLQALGCDVGQGFYFAGPQSAGISGQLLEPDLRWPTAPTPTQ